VPFERGRPLGVPNDPAFQKRVLLAQLKLLEVPEGPWILVDYPESAPEVADDASVVLSCPVYYGESEDEPEETDPVQKGFLREIKAMRPWYDMALAKRKRTTVGISRINLDNIGDFIYAFVKGTMPENPRQDIPIVSTLKLAIEDLRAYYFESATAQPGQENVSNKVLLNWFWEETEAGKVLLELLKICEKSSDEMMNTLAGHIFAPRDVVARHREG
jgi:hypothetical protein